MSYNRAEYDTEALRHNIRLVRHLVGAERKICAAVKANGYGMGVLPMAQVLLSEGVDYFAVANTEEGIELRKNGFDLPILVLGAIPDKDLPKAIYYELTIGIYYFDTACLVNLIGEKAQKKAKVHVMLDTGMHRLGFLPTEKSKGEIKVISEMPYIELEGIFSHLSQTDKSRSFTEKQIQCFRSFTEDLEKGGVSIPIRHIANSNAILDYPEAYFDMVRPGIILHGYGTENPKSSSLQEVLTLKSAIVRIHEAEVGAEVSYMGNYVTEEKRRIATIPIGYADGYFRSLSGKAEMLVRGKRVPQVGNICMDQCMIDVTEVPEAKVGDEVVLYGKQGEEYISVEEAATKANTISYELLTSLKRVPKYYYFEDEDEDEV